MRSFVRFCIYHPVFTGCSVIVWLFLGISSYFSLGVTLWPSVEIPFVLVRTVYVGAGPSEVEQLVSKPLEDALADLDGLKKITSYSRDSVSLLSIELRSGTDPDLAVVDVNNKIKAKRAELPSEIEEPVTTQFDINAEPFLIASFASSIPEKDAKKFIEDRLQPLVSRVDGVGQVKVVGGEDREIHVVLDPAALSDYGVSYQQVCAVVALNNQTSPSGYITQKNDEVTLRLVGEFNDVEQLENILVPTPNGQPVPLSLLGKVVDGVEDVRELVRANGQPVVQLRISPRANADVVRAGREIKEVLSKRMESLPEFSMTYTYDDTQYIETSVKHVVRDTAVGILLTALVIYLFLGRFSATFIVASSMPVAFMATFLPMQAMGYSLNLMSTLGLALSMGTLVMNSILIIQNIYRYRDMGYDPFDAAEQGTSEIAVSVLAGVMTNLGVFMPVALMTTLAGQFLKPYAVTILYATLFSLWVTMSVTPCLAARIRQTSAGIPTVGKILTGWWNWLFEGFQDLFLFLLKGVMKSPVITLLIVLGMTIGAAKLGSFVGSQFLPGSDDGTVTITLTLDSNVSLSVTDQAARRVEDFIARMQDRNYVRDVVTTVGVAGNTTGLNKASIAVYLKEEEGRPSTEEVADHIRPFLASLPGVQSAVSAVRVYGSSSPVEVHVAGNNIDELYKVAETLRFEGARIPGIVDLAVDSERGKPELQVLPIRWRLTPIGLNISDLAGMVRGYLIGRLSGKFRQDGYEYDIKSLLSKDKTDDVYSIPRLPVMTRYGLIPLEEMAEVRWGDAPTEIRRINRQRTVVLGGNLRYITAGAAADKFEKLIAKTEIPQGIGVSMGGESENMKDDFAELIKAMITAIVITYIVVAAIMESWLYSAIILLTVPMSMIGVIPAMILSGVSISIFSLIGMIMLVGMVVNNAIVVVDYAEVLRREGKHPYEAIETACRVRFKSLVMAVVTSVVSLLPLLLSSGRGSEMRSPIAVVAIGGIIAGGLLALLSIPAAYKICWAIRLWHRRRKGSDVVAVSEGS